MFDRTPKDHVKRLNKASKNFSRDKKQLLEDVVVELHELENLRNDLTDIKNEILLAKSVGSLKDPVDGTCAKPVLQLHGIFIGMKMASDEGYSRAISSKSLGTALKNKIESILINDWGSFRSVEQVQSRYSEVIKEFVNLVSPKVTELKQLHKELK